MREIDVNFMGQRVVIVFFVLGVRYCVTSIKVNCIINSLVIFCFEFLISQVFALRLRGATDKVIIIVISNSVLL